MTNRHRVCGLALFRAAVIFSGIFLGFIGCHETEPTTRGIVVTTPIPPPFTGRWVLVEGAERRLSVYDGSKVIAQFTPAAVGTKGVGLKARSGDQMTPLGTFRIGWKSETSKYHIFLGLDYPSADYATRALSDGRIDGATYKRIISALERGETPPQNTVLGGMIGIHGLGMADAEVHPFLNWTNGCIALTNEQIEELCQLISVGDLVHIR